MTNDFQSDTQNDGEHNSDDQMKEDKYVGETEKQIIMLGWLVWTLQVLLEIWGMVLGSLYILALFITGEWSLAGPSALAYLLVGVILAWQYEGDPIFINPDWYIGRRVPYILSWPIRQALRETSHHILTTRETPIIKQRETSSIKFSLFKIMQKWFIIWTLVVGIPIFVGLLLRNS